MARRIEIILTDTQYANLAESADAAGLVLTQWVTSCLLGMTPAPEPIDAAEAVVEPEDDVDPDDDPMASLVVVDRPDGAHRVSRLARVYSAHRGDLQSTKRLAEIPFMIASMDRSSMDARPGAIFLAYIGKDSVQVGRAVDGVVVWDETLPWDRAHRAETLDRLQGVATRDLAPMSRAWRDEEEVD